MLATVNWFEFHDDARNIAKQIRGSNYRFSAVYGIPRGGLVLATYLSHTLGLPLYLLDPGTIDVLVCDDNVITGETLTPHAEQFRATAALIVNPLARVKPTFYARESPVWPVFPWEADSCT